MKTHGEKRFEEESTVTPSLSLRGQGVKTEAILVWKLWETSFPFFTSSCPWRSVMRTLWHVGTRYGGKDGGLNHVYWCRWSIQVVHPSVWHNAACSSLLRLCICGTWCRCSVHVPQSTKLPLAACAACCLEGAAGRSLGVLHRSGSSCCVRRGPPRSLN